MKFFTYIFVVMITQVSLANQATFDEANEFYANESYDSALVRYESLLEDKKHSFEIYYNLGNTYFRTNQLGKAILYWEKARKIKPSDQQVIDNLNYAYGLAKDKFDVNVQSVGFIKGFVFEKSPNFWTYLSIAFSLLLAITLYLFFISKIDAVHQISFYVGIVSFICLITFIVFASMQKSYFEESTDAVVIEPRIKVMSSPIEGGEESFPLHEGTKVEILKVDGEFTEIRINKDTRGWVKSEVLGKI